MAHLMISQRYYTHTHKSINTPITLIYFINLAKCKSFVQSIFQIQLLLFSLNKSTFKYQSYSHVIFIAILYYFVLFVQFKKCLVLFSIVHFLIYCILIIFLAVLYSPLFESFKPRNRCKLIKYTLHKKVKHETIIYI